MTFPESLRRQLNGNNVQSEQDKYWIRQALQLAQQAANEQEVPVGAVIVIDHHIIGEGYNQPIKQHDPTAHAEINALRKAAAKLGNYRLINTTLYVTLEPCIMCVGAIIHARIKRLVYGASDSKAGAIISKCQLHNIRSNHKLEITPGILSEECGELLKNFFRARRS